MHHFLNLWLVTIIGVSNSGLVIELVPCNCIQDVCDDDLTDLAGSNYPDCAAYCQNNFLGKSCSECRCVDNNCALEKVAEVLHCQAYCQTTYGSEECSVSQAQCASVNGPCTPVPQVDCACNDPTSVGCITNLVTLGVSGVSNCQSSCQRMYDLDACGRCSCQSNNCELEIVQLDPGQDCNYYCNWAYPSNTIIGTCTSLTTTTIGPQESCECISRSCFPDLVNLQDFAVSDCEAYCQNQYSSGRCSTSATATTTAKPTTMASTTTQTGKSLVGRMSITVSNPVAFMQEVKLLLLFRESIAKLYEIVEEWVRNITVTSGGVTITSATRRLFQTHGNDTSTTILRHLLTSQDTGDVDVDWEIMIPPDADGEIVVEVLAEKFDSKTMAEVTQAVNTVINSGIYGNSYEVNVTWKYNVVEDDELETSTNDDSDSTLIIIIIILLVSFGAILFAIAVSCLIHFRIRKRAKRSAGMSLSNLTKAEAAKYKSLFSLEELLQPPDVITSETAQQLRNFARSMMQDVSSVGRTVPVFITYSDGQRDADAKGYGPGSYYAAAIIKHLYDNGISSFCELMYTEPRCHDVFCAQITFAKPKILIAIQTKALHLDRSSLREIACAQECHVEIFPLRFEEDLPSQDECWPTIQRNDFEGMIMLSKVLAVYSKLNSIPSPPYTIINQRSVLADFTTDLKLKIMPDELVLQNNTPNTDGSSVVAMQDTTTEMPLTLTISKDSSNPAVDCASEESQDRPLLHADDAKSSKSEKSRRARSPRPISNVSSSGSGARSPRPFSNLSSSGSAKQSKGSKVDRGRAYSDSHQAKASKSDRTRANSDSERVKASKSDTARDSSEKHKAETFGKSRSEGRDRDRDRDRSKEKSSRKPGER